MPHRLRTNAAGELLRASRPFPNWAALTGGAALAASLSASAVVPFGQPAPADVYDYPAYLFIRDGDCSSGSPAAGSELETASFPCSGEYKFTDFREPEGFSESYDPLVANNPQELYGVMGAATNRAWEVSTGRPDVIVAVMDSGIRWHEPQESLVNKHYLNRSELPVPQGGPRATDTRARGRPTPLAAAGAYETTSTASSDATASSIAMSTSCPRPDRSRAIAFAAYRRRFTPTFTGAACFSGAVILFMIGIALTIAGTQMGEVLGIKTPAGRMIGLTMSPLRRVNCSMVPSMPA